MISLGSSCSAAAGVSASKVICMPSQSPSWRSLNWLKYQKNQYWRANPEWPFFAGDVGVGDGGRLAFFEQLLERLGVDAGVAERAPFEVQVPVAAQPGDVLRGRRLADRRASLPFGDVLQHHRRGCRARCRRWSAGTARPTCRRAGRSSLRSSAIGTYFSREFFGRDSGSGRPTVMFASRVGAARAARRRATAPAAAAPRGGRAGDAAASRGPTYLPGRPREGSKALAARRRGAGSSSGTSPSSTLPFGHEFQRDDEGDRQRDGHPVEDVPRRFGEGHRHGAEDLARLRAERVADRLAGRFALGDAFGDGVGFVLRQAFGARARSPGSTCSR